MTLWFKQYLVPAILDGTKTDTIRLKPPRCKPGDHVNASVGPRRPFARLRITAIESIAWDQIDAKRRASLERIYPTGTGAAALTRVVFELVEATGTDT